MEMKELISETFGVLGKSVDDAQLSCKCSPTRVRELTFEVILRLEVANVRNGRPLARPRC